MVDLERWVPWVWLTALLVRCRPVETVLKLIPLERVFVRASGFCGISGDSTIVFVVLVESMVVGDENMVHVREFDNAQQVPLR